MLVFVIAPNGVSHGFSHEIIPQGHVFDMEESRAKFMIGDGAVRAPTREELANYNTLHAPIPVKEAPSATEKGKVA